MSHDDHLPLFVSLLVTDESNPGFTVAVADRAYKSSTGVNSGDFMGMPLCTLCCTMLCALVFHTLHSQCGARAPEVATGSKFFQ